MGITSKFNLGGNHEKIKYGKNVTLINKAMTVTVI